MNQLDRMARDIMRQARTPAQASRIGSGASVTQRQTQSATRVEGGEAKRLFVPDYSALNDDSTYLGDAPIGDASNA